MYMHTQKAPPLFESHADYTDYIERYFPKESPALFGVSFATGEERFVYMYVYVCMYVCIFV